MKMKLYYVVEKAEGFYYTHDFDYVAGPFSFDDAREHKKNLQDSYEYDVVEQEIEVN